MALNYADSKYLYGTYYHIGNNNDTNNGIKYDFLIQITSDAVNKYYIDALTGNYFKVGKDIPLKQQELFNRLIKPIYGIHIESSLWLLSKYPNPASNTNTKREMDTDSFHYFLERCNVHVILPVQLNTTRYFIKENDIDDEGDEDEGDVVNYTEPEDFIQGPDEVDEEAPASLIHTMCDIDISPCKFIDPILRTEYDYVTFRTTDYVEKSKEDYDKLINRLEPIYIQSTISQFDAVIQATLTNPFNPIDTKVTTINDLIEKTFSKHISFNDRFANDIAAVPNTSNTGPSALIRPTSILNTIPTAPINLRERFETIRFLRSYIDLYHDIENYANEYCDPLKTTFEQTLITSGKGIERDFLNAQIALIHKSIITKSGKVNQEKCRQEVERIADLFITELHTNGINTIPKTKESALVLSASIDNINEITSLITTLKADGVTGFYVESINNRIGEILVTAGLQLYNLTIGEWDAGSGFSGKKMKPVPIPIQIGPSLFVNTIPTAKKLSSVYLENIPINMFGLIHVSVSPNNNQLTLNYQTLLGIGRQTVSIEPRQTLSVNKVLTTTNNAKVRGTDETDSGTIKTTPQVTPSNDISARAALMSLKTWTDLIQIESISKTMNITDNGTNTGNPLKILTVIYDGLCETTARMYGLGHVLKCQGKIVNYYNYNIDSRHLSALQLKSRLKLRTFIATHKDTFQLYLNLWFKQRIDLLTTINTIIYDPILFFVSKLFIDKYTNAFTKSLSLIDNVSTTDIKLIPKSLDDYIESISSSATLLAELLEIVSKFKTTFDTYDNLGSRVSKDDFLNAYDGIQRLIVTTFGDNTIGVATNVVNTAAEQKAQAIITLRAMVASSFAYMILRKTRRDIYFGKLHIIKQSLLTTPGAAPYKIGSLANINKSVGNPLAAIRNLPDMNRNKKILQNIADIEIAVQTLSATPDYITYITKAPNGLIPINNAYSFENAIKRVRTEIDRKIANGTYFGGKSKKRRSKTHTQKRTKRTKHKTYKKRK